MIKQRSQLRKFIVAKCSRETAHAREKYRYRKRLEVGLVASLVVTILFFRLGMSLNIVPHPDIIDDLKFELIELMELLPLEPPQQLMVEEVVEVMPEVEDPAESDDLIEEIEALLGETGEEASLDLATDGLDGYLVSDSPLASLAGPQLQLRRNRASNQGHLHLAGNVGGLDDLSSGGLDIGTSRESVRKNIDEVSSGLDLKLATDPEPRRALSGSQEPEATDPRLGISAFPARFLSFSSSTIGTEDYKLWNKIVSELDRLNKGRYGTVARQIKRQKGGFLLALSYGDQTRHEIHWRNNGRVRIKVIGKSNLSNGEELRRALIGLLQLSL